MALDLRVNFNTIARAYRILDEVGIISTQQGRGTYVMEISPPEVSEKIRKKALEALTHRYLVDAERLGASPQELNRILKAWLSIWQKTGTLPDQETDYE